MSRGAWPTLRTVTCCGALWALTVTVPKSSAAGASSAWAPTPDPTTGSVRSCVYGVNGPPPVKVSVRLVDKGPATFGVYDTQ